MTPIKVDCALVKSPHSRVQPLSSPEGSCYIGTYYVDENSNSSIYQVGLATPGDWKLMPSPHFPCRQASQGNKLEPASFVEAKFHDKGGSEVTSYVCGGGTAVGQLLLSPYDTQPQVWAELSVARAFLLLCKQCQITMVCPFLWCFLLSYLISFYKFRPWISLAPNLTLPVIGL